MTENQIKVETIVNESNIKMTQQEVSDEVLRRFGTYLSVQTTGKWMNRMKEANVVTDPKIKCSNSNKRVVTNKSGFSFIFNDCCIETGHSKIYLIVIMFNGEKMFYIGKSSSTYFDRFQRRLSEPKDSPFSFMKKHQIFEAEVFNIEEVMLNYETKELPLDYNKRVSEIETKYINHYKKFHKEQTLNK